MFERFSRGARASVAAAQAVSRETASAETGTVHLALALLDQDAGLVTAVERTGAQADPVIRQLREITDGGGLDREALASMGIDLDAVSAQADRVFGPGALTRYRHRRGEPRWGRDAKKALELALREAIRLGDRAIETRHLLLGLLRANCPARTVLIDAGVDLTELRAQLEVPREATA